MMIQALRLANKSFPVNLIQGPLAGISCAPFRALTWQHSQPAFTYTEMISCKTLNHQEKKSQQRFIYKSPNEGPVCFQLAGNDPVELAEAVKRATDYGADLIDLNCGCPVKKIRSKGAGSRLLTDPMKLYQLITAMKQNTPVPVSVKIRVERSHQLEIAKVINDAGADFVVVHGRHWTEHYETPCRYEDIAFFVNELTMPVIGNGDVACVESLKKMFRTGCAGVMISRAGVGQPWLIKKLIADMRNEAFIQPDRHERGAMYWQHVMQLSDLLGNEKLALLQARSFAKYYARGMSERDDFCTAVNGCETMGELRIICQIFLG